MRDDDLEAMFDAARAAPPRVPDGLMARVQADAAALQPAARFVWRDWLRSRSGLSALGGFVTATCVGFWIGVAPPDTLPDLGGLVLGYAQDASFDTDGFGWDLEEG